MSGPVLAKPRSRPRFSALGIWAETLGLTLRAVRRKLGWKTLPLVIVLLLLAVVFLLGSAAPVLAPFVYTLF